MLTLENTVTCSYHVYVTTIFRRPVCARDQGKILGLGGGNRVKVMPRVRVAGINKV